MVANERHTQHTGARADGPSRPDPHSEMLTHDSLAILTQLLEELLLGFDLLIAQYHRQLGFSHKVQIIISVLRHILGHGHE